MNEVRYHRPLHLLAVLTTLATFPLIFMGGLVTSQGAGMSVPDWPNSYGYNMFLFPPRYWLGGILYEHTHRLMGTVVGFCAIALVAAAFGWARDARMRRLFAIGAAVFSSLGLASFYRLFTQRNSGEFNPFATSRLQHLAVGLVSLGLVLFVLWICRQREQRRWVRWLVVAVFLAVCFQGALGGLRVVKVNLDLAIVHACFAQAFFCLAGFTALVTSRWWLAGSSQLVDSSAPASISKLARFGIVACVVIYTQLIVGATMRHYHAGLAVPDMPLVYGHFLPPTDQAGLDHVNETLRAMKATDADLRRAMPGPEPVSMLQIWLHFGHRMGAIVVTLCVLSLAVVSLRNARSRFIRTLAVLLIGLIVAQFTLGVLVIWYRKAADVASIHVAGGALTLLSTFLLTIAAMHRTQSIPAIQCNGTTAKGDSSPGPVSRQDAQLHSGVSTA